MTKNSEFADLLAEAAQCLAYDASTATGEIGLGGYETEIKHCGSDYMLTIVNLTERRAQGAGAAHEREATAYRLGQQDALASVRNAIGRVTVDPYSAADQSSGG